MERRNNDRLTCYFKILLGDNRHMGYIHDISGLGLRVETPQPVNFKQGQLLAVKIIPPEETKLPNLICAINIRWIKKDERNTEFGGSIENFTSEKKKAHYQDYIDFYKKETDK